MIPCENLELLPLGCLLIDAQDHIVFANSEALRLLGKTKEELQQSQILQSLIEEKGGRKVTLNGNERESFSVQQEDRRGQKRVWELWPGPLLLTLNPSVHGGGLATLTDLSSLVINNNQGLLLEKKIVLGEIASVVAHDISNPLAIISSKASLLLRRHESKTLKDGEIEKVVSSLQSASNRISSFLKRFRNAIKDEDLNNSVVIDIHRVLDAALLSLRREFPQYLPWIQTPPPLSLPLLIRTKPHHLSLALRSLLLNAAEACELHKQNVSSVERISGGKDFTPRISVSIHPDRETSPPSVSITISDNGPGVPETQKPHLFEYFWTTKRPGKALGFGMGFIKRTIEWDGGTLIYENTEGELQSEQGSKIQVILPLLEETRLEE